MSERLWPRDAGLALGIGQLTTQVILGSAAFVQQIQAALRGKDTQPLARGLAPRPPWRKLWRRWRRRGRKAGPNSPGGTATRVATWALYLGRRQGRLTLATLARAAGLCSAAAVHLATKRYERLLASSPAEAQLAQACRRRLHRKDC